MQYSLRNDIIYTPFCKEWLNEVNCGTTISLLGLLKDRSKSNLLDLRINTRDIGEGKKNVVGLDLKSELLLYGFYCEGIRDDQTAVYRGYGYYGYWEKGEFLGILRTGNPKGDLYQVDRLLWSDLEKSEIFRDRRDKVMELVNERV